VETLAWRKKIYNAITLAYIFTTAIIVVVCEIYLEEDNTRD